MHVRDGKTTEGEDDEQKRVVFQVGDYQRMKQMNGLSDQ
jgi:hypothetical protein